MSTSVISCVFCSKECKNSDSRPYPSSRSKDRIHNKCQVKKALADKKSSSLTAEKIPTHNDKLGSDLKPTSMCILDKLVKEEEELKKADKERKLNKAIEEQSERSVANLESGGQFFFDIKAGIAKPHEKRRFLNHRNLCEIAARYDDNGFQEETIGRAYDCAGKDLNTLGDSDDDANNDLQQHELPHKSSKSITGDRNFKRKFEERNDLRRQSRLKVDEQNPCWFCLSSPNVEKHLIIAIGNFSYLTLAKGGLNDQHFLLLPIEHIQSLNGKENPRELLKEVEDFKESLTKYFGKQSMGVVFFERNFRSVHWQLQIVPIPMDKLEGLSEKIKTVSKRHFDNSNYIDIPDGCSLNDIVPPGAPYFYWQIEPTKLKFVCQIQTKGSFFPIQLGRIVLADSNLMNCHEKVDWKRCTKTKEEYIELVDCTKEKYAEFDITT